jgi:N-methylhydantoinase A/oxoprolinase/acetone carboxylase beta subunit
VRNSTPKAPFSMRRIEAGDGDPSRALKRSRTCRFEGRDVETPVYDGERLHAGDRFEGPAIIEEPTTTVVIPARYGCAVDEYRNYVLDRRQPVEEPASYRMAETAAGSAR